MHHHPQLTPPSRCSCSSSYEFTTNSNPKLLKPWTPRKSSPPLSFFCILLVPYLFVLHLLFDFRYRSFPDFESGAMRKFAGLPAASANGCRVCPVRRRSVGWSRCWTSTARGPLRSAGASGYPAAERWPRSCTGFAFLFLDTLDPSLLSPFLGWTKQLLSQTSSLDFLTRCCWKFIKHEIII